MRLPSVCARSSCRSRTIRSSWPPPWASKRLTGALVVRDKSLGCRRAGDKVSLHAELVGPAGCSETIKNESGMKNAALQFHTSEDTGSLRHRVRTQEEM